MSSRAGTGGVTPLNKPSESPTRDCCGQHPARLDMWYKQHCPGKLWKRACVGAPDVGGQAHLVQYTGWPPCSPTRCWPRPGCGPPPRLAPGTAASIASTHFLWARVMTQVAFVMRIAHTLALLPSASGRLCNTFKYGALSSTTHMTRYDKSAYLVNLKTRLLQADARSDLSCRC